MNDTRCGWGIKYDKNGSILYEGPWHLGNNSANLIVPSNCNDRKVFSSIVKELIIGDFCYNDITSLRFGNNSDLERVVIGNKCFCNVRYCLFEGCMKLKSITIGDASFVSERRRRTSSLIIRDCKELNLIDIGGKSFLKYDNFMLQSIIC